MCPVMYLLLLTVLISVRLSLYVCVYMCVTVELGVVIGKHGSHIPIAQAPSYIAGYVIALDMTARELQEVAKKKGVHPSIIAAL